MQRRDAQPVETFAGLPIVEFQSQKDWQQWLQENHKLPSGVWLRIAKKSSGSSSVTYTEALEVALCYGWIDGQKRPHSDQAWLQKFTSRGKRSIWSKTNCDRAAVFIKNGQMQAAGQREIDRAKKDGRWEAAYDSARTAVVPPDLQAALDENAKAQEFFKTLDSGNRYAVLFRIQTVKKAETRARKIRRFVEMLERNERIHP